MITPQDVRLGNLVIDVATNEYAKVVAIDEGMIITDAGNEEGCAPVPITQPLLSILGFKQSSHNKRDRFLSNREGDYEMVIRMDDKAKFYYDSLIEIHWLHQVQNIFAARNPGMELTVLPHEYGNIKP